MKTSSIWYELNNFIEEFNNQKQLQEDIKDLKENYGLTDEELEVYIEMYLNGFDIGEK